MMSLDLQFVIPSFDGPPDEVCQEEMAFFLPDAHQHVPPMFHRDARRIGDKALSVSVQQQEAANPIVVFNGRKRQDLRCAAT